ncbi:B12-binding domain-containing radical SAM protein [Cystobacter fuscus]|uniref:B12-binding domain-containing radical SAM protein n=1 Tax=Cystobacter fuscus TaxID=43 RepID=UPI002B2963B3|nr:B12-binding domain-containing radical SAM protein [Cystobacter fuscus]
MRVCLLSPPYGDGGESMRPIGLMAIHSYLEGEFGSAVEVELVDFSDCEPTAYALIDEYALSEYDIVGLCSYSTNFMLVRGWAEEIKRRNPRCLTVIGGPHATALPQHVAQHHSDVFDYVVRGEGERPMAAIVRAVLEGHAERPTAPGICFLGPLGVVGGQTTDPVRDLDTVPPPVTRVKSPYERETSYFDKRDNRLRRAVALTTSRGCPFTCSFCSIRASNSKWRSVSAERLSAWIRRSIELEPQPIEHVYFMDADFLINRKRVIEIGEMMARDYPKMTWSFSGRVDDLARLGEDAIAKLTTQGLRAIEMGLESGSQASLDRLNKDVTVKENYDAVAMLKRFDLELVIDFINFLPDSTPEHLRESLDFVRNAGLSEFFPADHLSTYLLLYPATPLRTFYGNLFNRTFSNDVLPEPDDLFIHEGTRRIFKHFVRDFRPYRGRLMALVETVERGALEHAQSDRELAQFLRIELVSLKHVQFLVLEALCRQPEAQSLLEAVPWLAQFEEHARQLEELCGRNQRAAA